MKKLIYIFAIAVIASSCNSANNTGGGAMNSEATKTKVQAFYDQVMNAHNPAMVDSFCTSDFVDHNPNPGHSGKGAEELKTSLAEFFTAFPDIKFTTNFMFAHGDSVAVHMNMTATNSGPMSGMPATNKQINMDGIDIIIVKDGKATDRFGFFDGMKMMQQLGMMPEPGAMPDSSAKKM